MSVPPRSTASKSAAAKSRRGAKGAPARPNRAQQRAMEVRASETRTVVAPVVVDDEAATVGTLTRRPVSAARARAGAARIRAVARPVVVSREQEYRYIRNDMRRMVLTASGLLVLMIALLFLVEA